MSTQGIKRHAGFTLIEVMLFLAVTGLLFLIGFWGTTFQVRNVRFTDSMRSLHSYLQKQYSLVATGANPREVSSTCTSGGTLGSAPIFGSGSVVANDTAGDAQGCVLLGKLIKFDPDSGTFQSYYVAGTRLTPAQLTGDDITDLRNSGPAISPEAIETQTTNWGTLFYQPTSLPATDQTRAFAYLRSPSSGRIIAFTFDNTVVDSSTGPGNDASLRGSGITTANLARNAGYCFKDSFAHKAIVKLGYDQRGDALDLAFDNFNQDTDCVRSKP